MVDRNLYLGGSDAWALMNDKWMDVYQLKLGEIQPEDLSGVFKVQLGAYTESFHLDWLQRTMGEIWHRDEFRQHPEHERIAGHIDGWIMEKDTFIEVKHSSGAQSMEQLVDRYLPQMAHYCLIHATDTCWFSVIQGNEEPDPVKVTVPQDYIDNLLKAELLMIEMIENRTPPLVNQGNDAAISGKNFAADVAINDMRTVDMTSSNEWAFLAADYLECEPQAKKFNDTKAAMKELVERDVARAYGHGIEIKRDKRGALRFYEEKPSDG